jgi:hypothetical protein
MGNYFDELMKKGFTPPALFSQKIRQDRVKKMLNKEKWLDLINRAQKIYEESQGRKSFQDILKDMNKEMSTNIDFTLFLNAWRRFLPEKIVSYKHRILSESASASLYYTQFSTVSQEKDYRLSLFNLSKSAKVNKDLIYILEAVDQGESLSQTARKLNFSKSRVSYVLISHGFDYKSLREKVLAEKNLESNQNQLNESCLRLRGRAFKCGLSVYDYLKLKEILGREIFSLFIIRLQGMYNNSDSTRFSIDNDKQEYAQVSALDILEVYLDYINFNFKGEDKRKVLLHMLKNGREYMLVRKDLSKPYIKNNVQVLSQKDHGVMVGKMFGTYSEYQVARK